MAKKMKKAELTIDELEQITFDAMRVFKVLPPTMDEVAAIDAELSNVELPFGPNNPDELLKRLDIDSHDSGVVLQLPQSDEGSVRNLARAAREGGELTTEIEQRMADDKAKLLQSEHGD